MFDAFDHGISTGPNVTKERKANTIQRVITLANSYKELMNMRKRTLIAFLNLQSANKILKAQMGGIRNLKVFSPWSQMFFPIAGEVKKISCNLGKKTYFHQTCCGIFAHNQAVPKEVCQLQKENTGKVFHNC